MSGFCGWVNLEAEADASRGLLDRMARRLNISGNGEVSRFVGQRAALGITAGVHDPRYGESEGHRTAVMGRFEFTDPELATVAADRDDSEALVAGLRKHGDDVLRHMSGAFAIAVVSETGRDALLAIDRVGGRLPLYYRICGSGVVFGTRGSSVQAHPEGKADVDLQAIYNYLYFNVVPGPRTARQEVRQLLPGTFLRVQGGDARIGTYWRAEFLDDDDVDVDELAEEFRSVLKMSVLKTMNRKSVACFLSGGTDSSTVAGLASQLTDTPVKTYSIGFEAEGYDEIEYARVASRHFGTQQTEHYITPGDVVDTIPRVAKSYSDPFGNASAVPTYLCARIAAKDGVDVMLGGDGGDELFAGNQRYATQRLFGHYEKISPFVRRRILEPAVFFLPGGESIPPVRKVRSYIRQAKMPMPARMESYNQLERTGPARILDPSFLASVDPSEPLKILEDVYVSSCAETMLNRMLALDLKYTIADNDLPKVSVMCEAAGVEVAYPMLSDAMMEFSFRVPARLKLKGRRLRWFMKYALRDFLPDEVLNKRKQGFGLPFGIWMRRDSRMKSFARENLDSLRSRGIVRSDYIKDLIHLHETEHATYYGVMIWVLMILEQWFQVQDNASETIS